MFDEVDQRLEAWVKEIFVELEISFGVPKEEAGGHGLCLYLLDVLPEPLGRGVRLPPLQVTLRYLIVPQVMDPAASHQLLGKLLGAAMENTEFKVEWEPLPLEIWRAFGIAPRPSFILLVPFKYDRTETLAPPVRHPLTVKHAVLETLQGQICANRIPMMDASVEIPSLRLHTKTDAEGNFRFKSLPSEPPDKDLLVRIKGRELSISTSSGKKHGNRFLFDLNLEE